MQSAVHIGVNKFFFCRRLSLTLHVLQKGEVTMDQAHRGYSMASDGDGFKSPNPLFMKYAPSEGRFSGQLGYGYRYLLIARALTSNLRDCVSLRVCVPDYVCDCACLCA